MPQCKNAFIHVASDVREKLRERDGLRSHFIGTFERFGTKSGYKGRIEQTVLLINVKDAQGEVVTDHLWFNLTQGFATLNLQPGDEVSFDARVQPYVKGYQGRRDDVYDRPVERDYKLSFPTRVRIANRARAATQQQITPPVADEQMTMFE